MSYIDQKGQRVLSIRRYFLKRKYLLTSRNKTSLKVIFEYNINEEIK